MASNEPVRVEQCDREAACDTYRRFKYGQPPLYVNIAAGRIDHDPIVQAFARHRALSQADGAAEIALTVIANWPITDPTQNQDAWNMAKVARDAIEHITEVHQEKNDG